MVNSLQLAYNWNYLAFIIENITLWNRASNAKLWQGLYKVDFAEGSQYYQQLGSSYSRCYNREYIHSVSCACFGWSSRFCCAFDVSLSLLSLPHSLLWKMNSLDASRVFLIPWIINPIQLFDDLFCLNYSSPLSLVPLHLRQVYATQNQCVVREVTVASCILSYESIRTAQ